MYKATALHYYFYQITLGSGTRWLRSRSHELLQLDVGQMQRDLCQASLVHAFSWCSHVKRQQLDLMLERTSSLCAAAPFGTLFQCLKVCHEQSLGVKSCAGVQTCCDGLCQLRSQALCPRKPILVFITRWLDIWVQARVLVMAWDQSVKWTLLSGKEDTVLESGSQVSKSGLGVEEKDITKKMLFQNLFGKDRLRLWRDGPPSCQDLWCVSEIPNGSAMTLSHSFVFLLLRLGTSEFCFSMLRWLVWPWQTQRL